MSRLKVVVLLVMLLSPIGVDAVAQRSATAPPTEEQIVAAFGRRDYEEALRLIARGLEADPGDSYLHYNRACAYALIKRPDAAAASLFDAVKNGFRDFDHMERDPDLASIRDHPTYLAIVEAKARVDRDHAQEQLAAWKRVYGTERYRYEEDEKHRLLLATALDERSHGRMREMLARQADQMSRTLFGGPPNYHVLVAIPTSADRARFFQELGDRDALFDDPNVAGIYEHRYRRLVSSDTGASLRHEFAHVMHYGHMERLGQRHPLWIQEGLASLYEEYRIDADGAITFLPNERNNVSRGLVRSGRSLPWDKLFRLKADRFMAQALVLYPQVRSIFEFLAARGLLDEWYRAYTETFERSPTGTLAFETVFEKPIAEVEREWRAWVAKRPRVDDTVSTGEASLGVEVENEPDGARVVGVLRRSAAADGGIRRGDVIVAVNDNPVASSEELVAMIARFNVGDRVVVTVRRRSIYVTVTTRLKPLPRLQLN